MKLLDFYQSTYSHEVNNTSLPVINYHKYPINRFDACFKYFIDNFKGGRILELGAGDGMVASNLLKSNLNIEEYVAADLSENRTISIKNSISDPRLKVQVIDVEAFDYTSLEKFDAIIMVALIEHLIDPLNTMSRIKSALKPNGYVYLDTPNVADYGCRFKLLKGKFPSTASRNEGLATWDNERVVLHDEGHLHYFTFGSLSNMLIEYNGFSNTKKAPYPVGRLFLGKRIHYQLAQVYPELFSYLSLVAYN
jgi:2-polyprenyl-3-methyl-5-hydroxy-6-metoxy-1,4-benzoquinol methylase